LQKWTGQKILEGDDVKITITDQPRNVS